MALPRPFETRQFILYEGETFVRNVAFVADIRDGSTGEFPAIPLWVRLVENQRIKPIRNETGYYCFIDLTPGSYEIQIEPESPAQDWYFSETATINLNSPNHDPLSPIVEVSLMPKPSYPFPGGITLLRGVVQTEAGQAVAGAEVEATSGGNSLLKTRTDGNGCYVMFFKRPIGNPVRINIRKNSKLKFKQNIRVGEGKPVSVDFRNFPIK